MADAELTAATDAGWPIHDIDASGTIAQSRDPALAAVSEHIQRSTMSTGEIWI